VFCLSSCHHDNKILNWMIFISDFSHSSAFYLTFSSACRLLVACTLRLSKSVWSQKLCMWSTYSTLSSRSILISFKLLIIFRLYCSLDWSLNQVFIFTFWFNSSTQIESSDSTWILELNFMTLLDINLKSSQNSLIQLNSLSNWIWRQES